VTHDRIIMKELFEVFIVPNAGDILMFGLYPAFFVAFCASLMIVRDKDRIFRLANPSANSVDRPWGFTDYFHMAALPTFLAASIFATWAHSV